MNSPFPGMDPYLERYWRDVHTKLIVEAANALNDTLPPDLVAATEERIVIEDDAGRARELVPDVQVLERPVSWPAAAVEGGVAIQPIPIAVQREPQVQRHVEIIEPETDRLITVIEIASPSNKLHDGLARHQAKRRDLLSAGVNVVEVDLVRRGGLALLEPSQCPPQARTTYRVILRPWFDLDRIYLIPIPLQDRLPRVAIPLRAGDPQVALDLQALVDRAYLTGRYASRIDYARPCQPPLEGGEKAWADEQLRSAGLM